MRTIGRPEKKDICTLSSHRATRELYAKVPSHRAPVGALCEGSMHIELRSELYAKGALCGCTLLSVLSGFIQNKTRNGAQVTRGRGD